MATEGVMTQRFHGGGPAEGALKAAVKAPSFTLAGQPCELYTLARRWSVGSSVTSRAVPSRTRSSPVSGTEMTQFGFFARLRLLRVPGPLPKETLQSAHTAPPPPHSARPAGR